MQFQFMFFNVPWLYASSTVTLDPASVNFLLSEDLKGKQSRECCASSEQPNERVKQFCEYEKMTS